MPTEPFSIADKSPILAGLSWFFDQWKRGFSCSGHWVYWDKSYWASESVGWWVINMSLKFLPAPSVYLSFRVHMRACCMQVWGVSSVVTHNHVSTSLSRWANVGLNKSNLSIGLHCTGRYSDSLSPLEVQSSITRRDGPELACENANFSSYLCNMKHRRLWHNIISSHSVNNLNVLK